jgi:ABC-type branched-subunit amino acid transport system substrate-binding protein
MNKPLRGMIDTRRALAASAALALILGVAACGGGGGGGGNGPGSTKFDLTIGNSLPLTGSSEALGDSGQKASQLALDRIKDAIDSTDADHTVRIVNEDQGSDADAAVESAKTLVDSDKASCLTGPWSSEAVAQTANDVAIRAKVLQISPVATGPDVAELSDHDLVVSTALPVSLEGDALAKAIESDLGGAEGNTVNVAASAGNDANTISQDFIESWQEEDGTVGSQIMLAPPSLSSPEQASQITGNSPDAVLLVDDPTGFAQLVPALLATSAWDPATTWGSDQLVSPGLPDEVGSDSIESMRALAPGAPEGEEPTSAFVQDFRSASPRDVKLAPYAAQQFDATVLCYLAAVAAGSSDGQEMADELIDITAPGGTEYSWQQLPDAIKALEDGEDIDYTGASGPIDMDVQGNPTSGVFDVFQYVSGNLTVVGDVPVEKPNPATP